MLQTLRTSPDIKYTALLAKTTTKGRQADTPFHQRPHPGGVQTRPGSQSFCVSLSAIQFEAEAV